jgi:hypothetical protein
MGDNKVLPKHAWVNCRETDPDLLFLGDVLTIEANIYEKAGNVKPNKIVGKIHHGTTVNILDKDLNEEHSIAYFKISKEDLIGWVSEIFLAWQWSSFTFIGNFKPAEVCKNLDLSLDYMGANLLIKNNGFAVVTEGDPKQFEIIGKAVSRFVSRIIYAQSPLTRMSLQAEFTNWVEVPIGDYEKRREVVGFPLFENKKTETISNSSFQDANSIILLMELYPYFDLALSDFYQALEHPQHALIFLSRAIESIENHFEDVTKDKNVNGKEKIMRESLSIARSDIEYVTKRANASHRRHASRDARVEPLPNEELAECFYRTAKILSAFATFINPSSSQAL